MATTAIYNLPIANGTGTSTPTTLASVSFDDSPTTTLTITETANYSTVYVGNYLIYTINIENTGTAPAENVNFTDIINDAHLDYFSHSVSGATDSLVYTSGTKTLAGSFGTIAVGATISVLITTKVIA